MSAMESLQAFHFLRPNWLWALPVLMGVVMWLARRRGREGPWDQLIDAELRQALRLEGDQDVKSGAPWPWLALAWALAVVALAGPTWRHEASTASRGQGAWVVVLDQSPSMKASDLAPSRTTRARYVIDDLLGAAQDARVALVVFSDEAYTVSPLTDDVATVQALLPPLTPDIMPSAGDHLAPALAQAQQLLEQTAAQHGHVIVLTDGFDDPAAALRAAAGLRSHGATVDVIGIGTPQGQTPTTRLNSELLQRLASAGGGHQVDVAGVPSLIAQLQSQMPSGATNTTGLQTAGWQDEGVWLLPLVLLLAAWLSRRAWL